MNLSSGSFRLFKIFGITVFLHWSWFLVAAYQIQLRRQRYTQPLWMVAEYLTLFAIVLTHEFGHALACRSVGGKAEQIVLWPLGGVAFVSPPPRPGATLWAIAAGPLVNVILLPITLPFLYLTGQSDWHTYLFTIAAINLGLLIFNMMPIYPLDGGQILRSLLWFVMGPIWSLFIASGIGMAGAAIAVGLALYWQNNWLAILAFFGAWQAYRGFSYARTMRQQSLIQFRPGWVCPTCGQPPPVGPFWVCPSCKSRFDVIENSGVCPSCGRMTGMIPCGRCGNQAPPQLWQAAAQHGVQSPHPDPGTV